MCGTTQRGLQWGCFYNLPKCSCPAGQMWAARPHLASEVQPEVKIWMSARRWHLQMLYQVAQSSPEMPVLTGTWLQICPGHSRGEANWAPAVYLWRRIFEALTWGQAAGTDIQSQVYWCRTWNGRLKARDVSQGRLMWAQRWVLRVRVCQRRVVPLPGLWGVMLCLEKKYCSVFRTGELIKVTKS